MTLQKQNNGPKPMSVQELANELFGLKRTSGSWSNSPMKPAMDVYEENDTYTIKMNLPGMDDDEISVSVSDRTVSIRGERKDEQKHHEEKGNREYYRSERRTDSFRREISLPDITSSEDVQATYERGVLTVKIPKAQGKQTKHIEVQTK